MQRVACVVASDSEFAGSMHAVANYLRSKGFLVHQRNLNWAGPMTVPIPPGGCDVAVWLSHGGWDGPIVFRAPQNGGQIDPVETPRVWDELKSWMGRYMKPGGMFISHSCHSAGSNDYERADGIWGERWVHQLARDMNLYTAGVEGSTASANFAWALQFIQFALEGRSNRQASRAYRPGGQLDRSWAGWLNQR